MKTLKTYYRTGMIGVLFLVAVVQSCKKNKATSHTPKLKSEQHMLQRISNSEISVVEGIPRYSTLGLYTSVYEELEAHMNANFQEMAITYEGITTDEGKNEDLAWQIWEETFSPLRNFESTVGFDSKSKEDHENEKTWLISQGENLNMETYPDLTGVGIIQKTMMNKDGNFMIGDDLYHIESDLKTVKVEGWTDLSTASKTYIGKIFEAMGQFDWAKIEGLFAELDDHVVISNNRGNPQDECKTNKKDGFWVNVDSKTKYAQHSAIAYDLIKTSAYHEVRAYAKFFGKWVPAVTRLKVGIQLIHRKTGDCTERTRSWSGDNSVWYGSFAFIQNNFWNSQRAIFKPKMNSSNSAPEEGFFGTERVKNLDYLTFSPLRITY